MILSIASGKGGTGKTTLAVNLALTARQKVILIDCDVEEPNCNIFLKIPPSRSEKVFIPVPVVNEELCTSCGECSRFCRYNAIISLKTKPLVFPELCHGCGGCSKICPESAIKEIEREIGEIEVGKRGNIVHYTGRLNIGEPMAPPLIRSIKKYQKTDSLTIIDCPPGTSCSMVASIKGSDHVVLITEPTPFGLNDLKLAVETVRELNLNFSVVINRANCGDMEVKKYCEKENIPIMLEIPDDRRVAEAYSRGEAIADTFPEYKLAFEDLLEKMDIL